jgi:exoribonuclease-2
LEQLAALGKSAGEAQETRELVDEIIKLSGLSLQGKPEQKAFELLVRMGRFSKDQNLTPLRLGRPLEFSKEVLDAANILAQEPLPKENSRMRLENLYTLTIDGEETKDFDDSLTIERLPDGIKVGIHITDAAAVVKQGSLLEEEAFRRATSIYCPDDYFPMLPPSLSEEKLSLIEATHRQALSFFVQFDRNWEICSRSVHRSLISIDKRLTYEEVDKILCDEPQGTELAESLDLFWQAASAYEHRRLEAGAVQFDRREMFARLTPQGRIVLEPANDETPARKLVAELMILANETAALFAKDKSLPLVFRTQEPPDTELATIETGLPDGPAREYFLRGQLKRSVISTSPASHYGLGIGAYCQVTSPIRRATDLINQRQINHFLDSGEALYSSNDLSLLLATLEQGLEEASLIQRERNRYWLLKYLQQEKIHKIEACIVRIDGPKPLAELDILFALYPFIPLERQISKEALGRKVRLKIERINPHDQTLMLKQIS